MQNGSSRSRKESVKGSVEGRATYVRFILRERSLRARKEEREGGKRGREKVVDFLINLREKEREKVL